MLDYTTNSDLIRSTNNLSESQKTGLLMSLMLVKEDYTVDLFEVFKTMSSDVAGEYINNLKQTNLLINREGIHYLKKYELIKQKFIFLSDDPDVGYRVYLHKRRDNGIVFYVGLSKNKRRPNSTRSRSKEWKDMVKSHGRVVEIVAENLSKEEARQLEIKLISKYGRSDLSEGTLCNHSNGGEIGSNRNKPKK